MVKFSVHSSWKGLGSSRKCWVTLLSFFLCLLSWCECWSCAVHWRFEESECGSHQIGLCFVRCADGAVIDSGLHPVAKEWLEAAEVQCNRDGHFRGVGINKMDVIEAIAENAANHSVKMVYLATDGWLRGSKAIELVTEVFIAKFHVHSDHKPISHLYV